MVKIKLRNISPISSADFLLKIEGLGDTYWNTFTGLEMNISRPTYSDGLSNRTRMASTGTEDLSEITMTTVYDPDQATTIIQFIEDHRDGTPFSASVQAVRRGKKLERRSQKTLRVSGCKLTSYSYPGDINTNDGGNSVSMISITFKPEDYAYAGIEATTAQQADV